MRTKEYIKQEELKYFLYFLLLVSIILCFFHILRLKNTTILPTYELYEHIGNIKLKLGIEENISILDWAVSFGNSPFLMRVLPFLLGLFNISLIYLILKELIKVKIQRIITIFILILSPTFIYVHGVYNNIFLPLFFILLASYSIIKEQYFLSGLFFIFTLILNPKLFIILLFLLIVFYEKYKAKSIYIPIISMLFSAYFFITITKNAAPATLSLYYILTEFVSDFGTGFGPGIFGLMLASAGLILSWEDKMKNSIFYAALISIFVCSLYENSLLIFTEFLLVYYAGLAFTKFYKTKWESYLLKKYVLILIICGLVFSSGSFIKKYSELGPNNYEVFSLDWLKKTAGENDVVMSHYEYGFLLNSYQLNSYVDKNYFMYSKDKMKIKKLNEIFESRDFEEIIRFLENNDIKYVWINKKMKEGQVWKKDDAGILLIIKNSINFKKIYDYGAIEIWTYSSTS